MLWIPVDSCCDRYEYVNVIWQSFGSAYIIRKMERAESATVKEKAEYLEYLSGPEWANVKNISLKARALEAHFGIKCSRQRLSKWMKPDKKAEIEANAGTFASSSKHTSAATRVKPMKRAVSQTHVKFEKELCVILYKELGRRNLSLEFIAERANELHLANYSDFKPPGRPGQLNGTFGVAYCRKMLKRNGWAFKRVLGTKKPVPAHVFQVAGVPVYQEDADDGSDDDDAQSTG